nr:MAG TPA_asm: hypothetical protein [Caudoviricetes sp.]
MTKRMTQKEIKRFVALGVAEDITHLSFDACNALRKAHNFTTLNVSTGVYGMNGALFKDENGKLYAITSRTSTLFQMV